ncbi:hypothetical protein J4Q44_G00274010, partial [Coregonus suidteri]
HFLLVSEIVGARETEEEDRTNKDGSRPKRLLVYINPYSGKQSVKRIYEQRVASLFFRASISTDVIVTESANHARDHLKTEVDLKQCDWWCVWERTGCSARLSMALVSRTQSDSRVDQNQPNQDLVPCALHIEIIPVGSTDCICYATTGTNDPVTSALHIIMGTPSRCSDTVSTEMC